MNYLTILKDEANGFTDGANGVERWLSGFKWQAVWVLSGSVDLWTPDAALEVGTRVLEVWKARSGQALSALLLADPFPATGLYHLHGLLTTPTGEEFNLHSFKEFSRRWGQSWVRPYEPRATGGYCRYLATKILMGREWTIHGDLPRKEAG